MNSIFRLNPQVLSCAIALSLGIGALTAPPPAHAWKIVHDPAHTAKTMQNIQQQVRAYTLQYQQYLEQLRQYQEMLRQGMKLGDMVFDPVQSTITEMVGLYQETKTLASSLASLDQEFREHYQGYGDYLGEVLSGTSAYNMSNRHSRWTKVGQAPDPVSDETAVTRGGNSGQSDEPGGRGRLPTHDSMAQQYQQWAKDSYDNARVAMAAAGIPVRALEEDTKALQRLVERSSNAEGRMQAIQAGNEIAAMMVQQMQRLNILVADQLRLQSNWIAYQTDRTYASDSARQKLQNPRPQNSASQGFRGSN